MSEIYVLVVNAMSYPQVGQEMLRFMYGLFRYVFVFMIMMAMAKVIYDGRRKQ